MRSLQAFMVVALLFAGCASRRQTPVNPAAPRTVVFLIHGIGGNPTHFGHMQEALLRQLNTTSDGSRFYDVAFLNYDTGSNIKDTYAFAREIADGMHRYFGGAPRKGDRISLVMHSQGGLVGAIWLYKALQGEAAYHPEYLPLVDAYVSMATPFWGAKVASMVTPLKETPLVGDVYSPLPGMAIPGHRQLQEMSFGSETIFAFRDVAIEMQTHPEKRAGLPPIRTLNFAGSVVWMPGSPFTPGSHEFEDDTAVMIPSARSDFIYGRALDHGYADAALVDNFTDIHVAPFQLVNAIHLSPSVDLPQISHGMVQVQRDCIENLKCSHPSFRKLVAHLLGQPVEIEETLLKKMTGFLLDVNVRLDGEETVTIDFQDPPRDVSIARPTELYSAGKSYVVEKKGVQRFYFTGSVERSYVPLPRHDDERAFTDRTLAFSVSAPGYKTRNVQARVRATYSTFVDVLLERP